MAATRNQFIHHYFGIDYDIFWDIIEKLKAAGAEGILVIPIEKMIL